MRKLIYFLTSFLLLSVQAIALIRHVPAQYATIQYAINSALNGDTILVSPGTYYENIHFRGKGIVVASLFLTTGDTTYIESTVINGSQPIHADTASCVIIASPTATTSADTTAALIGFRITGGNGTRWQDEHNPGSWYREGGGIVIQYLSPRIYYNHIAYNQAINYTNCVSAGGGGIRCGDGNPRILHNVIEHNQGRYGGGLVFNFAGAVIKNNIISGNSGGQDFGGGGVWVYGVNASGFTCLLTNNTIVGNSSLIQPGGGIRSWFTVMHCTNNIIWGNSAPNAPQIAFDGGTFTATYSDVEGGYTGNGNRNVIPQFDAMNFFLNPASPCIDAGDSSLIYNDPEDLLNPGNAKFPAMGNLRNDMGAYGGPGSTLLPSIQTIYTTLPTLNPDENPFGSILIYPDPVTEKATLSFCLKDKTELTISIFSILGETLLTLNKNYHSGNNQVTIPVDRLTTGTCFCRITYGNLSQTIRFEKIN